MNEQRNILVDLRIPFFRLVFFFIKATLAAISAGVILGVVFALVGAIVVATFGASGSDFMMHRWTY